MGGWECHRQGLHSQLARNKHACSEALGACNAGHAPGLDVSCRFCTGKVLITAQSGQTHVVKRAARPRMSMGGRHGQDG